MFKGGTRLLKLHNIYFDFVKSVLHNLILQQILFCIKCLLLSWLGLYFYKQK